jgi:hypothetical protein
MKPVPLISESQPEPPALHDRAMDNLRYIRETMELATAFTGISGWGEIAIGITALVASAIAALQTTFNAWLAVWIAEGLISLLIAGWSMDRKTRVIKTPLGSGPGRKAVFSLTPPMLAGGLLTIVLVQAGLVNAIPGVWLLLYGTGVITGGMYSVKVVPIMGICLMALGALALFSPPAFANWFMAVGFGGLHVVFGAIIVRKYGG